jgi:cardiolipin synthase (CMP-forming)
VLKDLRAAPNQLTFLRLCIIPFLVIAVLDGRYRTAFALFILAGISDGLDGLLARILQQRTRLGEYLDPIADKLLLSTLFLVLMHQGLIPRRVTILVFSRDVGLVVVGALLFATTGARDFRPSLWGKANTVAQIIAVASTLWTAFYAQPVLVLVRRLSLIATFALTLISWFHYTWRETRRLGSEESRNSV